ncbi:hypothetical protein HK405_012942, partial [Cladochytrium tenue]
MGLSGESTPTSQQQQLRSPAAGSRKLPRSPSVVQRLTVVIKLGTSSICDEKTLRPRLSTLSMMVETIFNLRQAGHAVVLVTSGAVGVGLQRMNLDRRPKHLAQVQALAAVGQGRLMALYDDLFGRFDIPVAQVLITKENMAERAQYLNACNTLRELLQMGVVPIVNENDTISNAEIRFGDNDTLSAITAGMVGADYLFLCTDVECLYTDNPRVNPDAKPVRLVKDLAALKARVSVATPGSSLGTGGMVTKLIAAELATAAGCAMVITLGSEPRRISQFLEDAATAAADDDFEPRVGTLFVAQAKPMVDRRRWILHGLAAHGAVYVDAGAAAAIAAGADTDGRSSSLFAAGVVGVSGSFGAHQNVRILTVVREPRGGDEGEGEGAGEEEEAGWRRRDAAIAADDPRDWDGAHDDDAAAGRRWGGRVVELARGLAEYAAADLHRIRGCRSDEIAERLGYVASDAVVHRSNLAVVPGAQALLAESGGVVWVRRPRKSARAA